MSDPSLAEVQQWMKASIEPGAEASQAAAELLALNPQLNTSGQERLSVYAGGYLARMREALAEIYEAVHQVLGDAAFTQLTQAYVQHHPSQDYNLNFIGRHLPTFLMKASITSELPFLPDLATLEWLVCIAFHAFEQSPIDPTDLASLSLEDWACARLCFQPSVGVVASAWPIRDIWDVRKQPREHVNIPLLNRPQQVLVFRQGLQVRCELIEPAQSAVLQQLLAGRLLEQACAELLSNSEISTVQVTTWFARWARLGLIIECPLSAG